MLKLGSKGSAIITKDVSAWGKTATMLNPQILQDYKIVDTVGAGDCFTGAFAVKHAELEWGNKESCEANYLKAMQFGNCAAFLCITKPGAMPSLPWRAEVDKFI